MATVVNADKRDSKGRFTKGNAPKSPGRPAVARDFRKRCREFMEAEGGGWDELISLAKDRKAREQRFALELIASYAYGKPKQGVELSSDGGALAAVVVLPSVNAE